MDDRKKVNYNEDDPFLIPILNFLQVKEENSLSMVCNYDFNSCWYWNIFYLDADKNNISGKWVSQDNKNLIYTFNSDNTFEFFRYRT